ncbi:MAG: hypothetical protein O7B24_04080 [Alphaproteobacteria bacterium]|nr:hypothetical protein [Alphaproteobacteria bacterium]
MDEHGDRRRSLVGGKIEAKCYRSVRARQRHVFDRVHANFAFGLVEIGVITLARRAPFGDADVGRVGQRRARRFQLVENRLQTGVYG